MFLCVLSCACMRVRQHRVTTYFRPGKVCGTAVGSSSSLVSVHPGGKYDHDTIDFKCFSRGLELLFLEALLPL